jgi:hypothetical protein
MSSFLIQQAGAHKRGLPAAHAPITATKRTCASRARTRSACVSRPKTSATSSRSNAPQPLYGHATLRDAPRRSRRAEIQRLRPARAREAQPASRASGRRTPCIARRPRPPVTAARSRTRLSLDVHAVLAVLPPRGRRFTGVRFGLLGPRTFTVSRAIERDTEHKQAAAAVGPPHETASGRAKRAIDRPSR